jgi:DNA recombination protein RmuC
MTDYIIIGLLAVLIVLLVAVLARLGGMRRRQEDNTVQEQMDRMQRELRDEMRASRKESNEAIQQSVQNMSQVLLTAQSAANTAVNENLESIRKAMTTQLSGIREENNRQLEQMRQTVDEKLSATVDQRLEASFAQVTRRLEQVTSSLSAMQSLAGSVDELSRTLGGAQPLGVWGEMQLGALLSQMLAPDQYAQHAPVSPGGENVADYVVVMPGQGYGHTVSYEAALSYNELNPDEWYAQVESCMYQIWESE